MHSRRTFFGKLASFAAVVAIAPRIAFGAKPDDFVVDSDVVMPGDVVEFNASFWGQRVFWQYSDDWVTTLGRRAHKELHG